MLSPVAFLISLATKRTIWSLVFEVLPVWLLTMQSVVALSNSGDVDGRSNQPLFAGPRSVARGIRNKLTGQNSKVNEFLGRWSIQERHNIDEFLEALGFSSWQRAIISHAGQSYTLEHGHGEHGDTLRIVTQDLRGTSELELPLSGKSVSANDGDDGARVCRAATVKGNCVVVTESFPGEREPFSVCKRTIQQDGRMSIDVTKKTPGGKEVAMRCIAAKLG